MSKPFNRLYYGDCLSVMREMPLGSVDLVYLDPPFNSNRDYNAIYRDETGRPLPDQVEAFNDLWELTEERLRAIKMMPILMRDAGIDDDVAQFWRIWLEALRNTQPRLLAYLSYMTERLLPLRGIVKPTGSIFLHCDPTASHYIKVMMDGIFGHANFRNEIYWYYYNKMHDSRKKLFPKATDSILWYVRDYRADFTFNPLKEERDTPVRQLKRVKRDGKAVNARDADGKLLYQVSTERTIDNVWRIAALQPASPEKLGYPTQKPVKLLERIIEAASNEGQVVFDPFCGCATTIEAAHKLKRKWIGIDIAIHAIKRVAKVRLEDRLGLREGVDFLIEGVPQNLEGAQDLWERDKYQFQKWAIEQVDGFVTARKTSDGGIDGRLYFSLPDITQLQSMVIEVKGGKGVGIDVIRSLRGVLQRDTALMAGLIIMDDLGARKTLNFRREMGDAGDLDVNGVLYPRMQMLTVSEIIGGKRFTTPSVSKAKSVRQPVLPFG